MNNEIIVLVLDEEGYETDKNEHFETLKEARDWIKRCGLDAEYWRRRAESADFAAENVHTIQLHKNGECIDDWFPKFK